MSAQHTPGPWRVIIDDDGNPLSGRPSVVASDELDCGIVHWDGFVQTYWRSARGDKEIHANARLIAAAPDLLEQLESAALALEEASKLLFAKGLQGTASIISAHCDLARDAIKKATQS